MTEHTSETTSQSLASRKRPERTKISPEMYAKAYAFLQQAESDLKADHLEDSLEALKKAAALIPWDPAPHRRMGILSLRLGRYIEAEICFRKWVKVAEADPDAYFFLGVVCHQRGFYDRALKSLDEVLRLKPNYRGIEAVFEERWEKGKILQHLREDCLKRITADNTYQKNHIEEGLLQLGFHHYEKAIEEFQRVLAVDPKNVDARLYLAHTLMQRRRDEEALCEYERVLENEPRNVDAYKGLALIHVRRGEAQKARDRYEQVIRIKPDDREARQYLSRAASLGREE